MRIFVQLASLLIFEEVVPQLCSNLSACFDSTKHPLVSCHYKQEG